jgi:hypothetical protein
MLIGIGRTKSFELKYWLSIYFFFFETFFLINLE